MEIAIVNLNAGNIKSIENFFKRNFNGNVNIFSKPSNKLDNSDVLIIPGVGNFGHASDYLRKSKLEFSIKKFAERNKPLIGICLGAQILTNSSEEAPGFSGLSLIDANCLSLKEHPIYRGNIPRIGWCGLENDLNLSYYFVHSYYIKLNDKNVCVEYCEDGVTALLKTKKILATQFHPEKSDINGKNLIRGFIEENV